MPLRHLGAPVEVGSLAGGYMMDAFGRGMERGGSAAVCAWGVPARGRWSGGRAGQTGELGF